MRRVTAALCIAFCVGSWACGGSSQGTQGGGGDGGGNPFGMDSGGGNPDTGGMPVDSSVLDSGAPDTSEMDTGLPDSGFPVAAHPPMPQVTNNGGPVLHAPVLTSVTFSGYDQTTSVDMFVSSIGATPFWMAALGEYNVGPATAATPVHLTETAPASIDDSGIQTWLAGKLDGTHAEFGTPTANSLYVLFYPSSTAITLMGAHSCSAGGFGGYHNSVQLSTGPWAGMNVSYAVVPECFTPGTPSIVTATESASHELEEACTDPYPLSGTPGPTYMNVDADHAVWEALLGGGEVADLCAQFPDSFYEPPNYTFFVQRPWSNAAAAGSHDPCQPARSNVYFNAAPVMNDAVLLNDRGFQFQTKGVLTPLGQAKTIEVDLYSDGPMAAWDVSATDLASLIGGGPYVNFSWDKTTGMNGDKLHLTVTPMAQSLLGGEPFFIVSTNGIQQHVWVGFVSQN